MILGRGGVGRPVRHHGLQFAIYARIGTASIVAVNIAATIEGRLAFVAFIGVGTACAIMIGNRIGAGALNDELMTPTLAATRDWSVSSRVGRCSF